MSALPFRVLLLLISVFSSLSLAYLLTDVDFVLGILGTKVLN